ncbi:sensor histidine kinase [Alicyclobacillus acidiphilus]|uniref:sensor histidine kinase n=1 Tax=Alicyclobacillus acidiphilus TaxID=182455 RepID=UPI001FE20EB2|nr:sensor histidine kinase [Alicyclobacillus acidiphilus]
MDAKLVSRWHDAVMIERQYTAKLLRRTAIVLAVVFVLWDSMTHGPALTRMMNVAECLIYCGVIALIPHRRLSAAWNAIPYGLIAIITVVWEFSFQHTLICATLIYFIVGIAGGRMQEPWTWWIGGMGVAAAVIPLVVERPFGPHPVAYAGYMAGLLGVFVGARNSGIRRRAREAQLQYLAELEKAHRALQAAHADLQDMSVQAMQLAVVEERNRIARDIHDSVGHALTTLVVQLQALQFRVQRDVQGTEQQIKDLVAIARQSLDEVRRSVRDVADAEPISGIQAMSALVDGMRANSGIDIVFRPSDDTRDLPLETGAVLYRVLQEALTNMVRHSGATSATVRLDRVESVHGTDAGPILFVRLQVEDNGKANPSEPPQAGFGLRGMSARCQDVGGKCCCRPVSPHGFLVEATIPWRRPSAQEVRSNVGQ